MKLNMFYPPMGTEKCFEFDDIMLQPLYDKRMSQEVAGDFLGDMFKGYLFRISGGNDKQGFAMKQGVLVNHRVRLLLSDGSSSYRIRRDGERRRKSVRGCIVGPDLSVLNLVIIKQGDKPIPQLTEADSAVPRRRGPKRASKIRKLFNLSKKDDVKKYVIRREFVNKKGKKIDKAPKIQRLITPARLTRKRQRLAERKSAHEKAKLEAQGYHKLLEQKAKELKLRRASSIAQRIATRQHSGVPAAKDKPKMEKSEKKVDPKVKVDIKVKVDPKVKVDKKLEKKPTEKSGKKMEKVETQPVKPKQSSQNKKPVTKEAPESSKKQTQKPGGKVVPKVESKVTEKAVTKPPKVEKKSQNKPGKNDQVPVKNDNKKDGKNNKPQDKPQQKSKEQPKQPKQSIPASKPVETKPTATKPVVTKPVTKPVDAKPVTKPVETKPVVAKPAVTKPTQTQQPKETKKDQKPVESKPKPVVPKSAPQPPKDVKKDQKPAEQKKAPAKPQPKK